VAVGFSVAIFFLIAWYQRRVSAWVPIALVLCALFAGAIFYEGITNRVLGDDKGSAESRVPLIRLAMNIIEDHPVAGVGINNAAVAGSQYAGLPQFRSNWFYTVHNKYLLEWTELGVFGLAAFLWFLIATVHRGWITWLRKDSLLSPIALGLILAIVGQMLHMTVDIFNSRAQVQSLWLCAALIFAMSRVEQA
jgi:O-antigen ligase